MSRPCNALLLQISSAPRKECPPLQALIQQFYSKMNQHGGSSQDLLLRQLFREERPPEQIIPHQLYWLMQNEPVAPPSAAPEQDALPNSILLDCCQHQRHEDGFAQEGDTQKSCQLHGHLEGESPVLEKFLPYADPDKCLDDPLKDGSYLGTSFDTLAADIAIQQTPNHQHRASPMLTDTPQQHSFGAGLVEIVAQQSLVGWGSKVAEDVIHIRHQQFKLRQQPDGVLMQRRLMRQRGMAQAPAQHSHDTAMENSHEGWNLNLAQDNLREIQRLQRLALRQADSALIQRRIVRGRLMRKREVGEAHSLQ